MTREDADLREAFAAVAEVAGGDRCPAPNTLWASACEELEHGENEAVVLHLAECTACAMAWRLAREIARRPSRSLRRWALLAAAAAIVVGAAGILAVRLPRRAVEESVYRGQQGSWLDTRVPAGTALPRGAFVLRWAAGPAGTTYDVHVMTEQLEPVAQASGLKQAEYRVGDARLARVAPGERVLWRVIAHLPDGRTVASRTFLTTLE